MGRFLSILSFTRVYAGHLFSRSLFAVSLVVYRPLYSR